MFLKWPTGALDLALHHFLELHTNTLTCFASAPATHYFLLAVQCTYKAAPVQSFGTADLRALSTSFKYLHGILLYILQVFIHTHLSVRPHCEF